jgi:hypothetical protein
MSTTTDSGRTESGSGAPINPGPGHAPAPDPSEELPLADRLRRDPSNLGDDIRDDGDLVYPDPEPATNNL